MKKVLTVVMLVAVACMFIFSGCQNNAAMQTKIDELSAKLDTATQEIETMKAKVDGVEKLVADIKTNHPEVFEAKKVEEPKAPAKTTGKAAPGKAPAKAAPAKKTK